MTTNLLEEAIKCDDGDQAAKIILDALGIGNDDVVNYCSQTWPADREQRARIIGEWLQTEARYLALMATSRSSSHCPGYSCLSLAFSPLNHS